MDYHGHLLLLPPNRVWRTYPGGKTLDRLEGKPEPADSHYAEDWIGSVTRSLIPGREAQAEGVSTALIDGRPYHLGDLVRQDPEYLLGRTHLERYGPEPMLLVKFLDSSLRLHFQCHPSRAFAREVLGARSGKTEAYHILGVREGTTAPFIYMGFQHPPAEAELRRMILEQDTAAMERCFERIPVAVGDTFLIPGGFPHALGGGVFMVEIQEPTDFAVRYEFERGGYVLPEAARFMGRGLEFALSMIDLSLHPLEEIESRYRCRPEPRRDLAPGSFQEVLIGPDRTPCFRVHRSRLNGPARKTEDSFHIGIVTAGSVEVGTARGAVTLRRYEKYFAPAGLELRYTPGSDGCEILECLPPL